MTPPFLDQLVAALPLVRGEQLTRFLPPPTGGRQAAVLALFGEGEPGGEGPDLLLIERAATMRSHAGQPAFPGGAEDEGDGGPVGAALRESQEEVGLEPSTVTVLGTWPQLFLPPSGFVVTPVLGFWHDPHPVRVVDTAEVAAVVRVPVAQLADPERRVTITHPSGWKGPGFDTDELLVWGFTAGIVDALLRFGGWERPWDRGREQQLDEATVKLALRSAPNLAGSTPAGTVPVPER